MENYITDTEDSSESLIDFVEKLSVLDKVHKDTEHTRETAVTNSESCETENPGIKTLAVPEEKVQRVVRIWRKFESSKDKVKIEDPQQLSRRRI